MFGFSRLAGIAASAVVVLTAAGCGTSSGAETTIRVYAAASLTQTFTELADAFEENHPAVAVELSFGGSADLAAQLQEGAPGDVVATADERSMAVLDDAGLLAGAPRPFVLNTLTIATAPDNPLGISGLSDLTQEDLTVVICAEQVPCGAATSQVLQRAGVQVSPASEETAVTGVVSKVASGQADAGLVYKTDAAVPDADITAVDFPEAAETVNRYPIGTLAEAAEPEAAGRFVDFILSDSAREVFDAAGFGTP